MATARSQIQKENIVSLVLSVERLITQSPATVMLALGQVMILQCMPICALDKPMASLLSELSSITARHASRSCRIDDKHCQDYC